MNKERLKHMKERGWKLIKDKHSGRQVYFKLTGENKVIAREGGPEWKKDLNDSKA